MPTRKNSIDRHRQIRQSCSIVRSSLIGRFCRTPDRLNDPRIPYRTEPRSQSALSCRSLCRRHLTESGALREDELPVTEAGFSECQLATVRLSAKCSDKVVVLAVFAKLPLLANSTTFPVS